MTSDNEYDIFLPDLSKPTTIKKDIDDYLSSTEEEKKSNKFSNLTKFILLGKKQKNFIDNILQTRQVMESTFNIFNHQDDEIINKNPLHEIMLHPVYDTCTSSFLYKYIELFNQLEIYKNTGIDIESFFNMSPNICRKIIKQLEDKLKEENSTQEDQLRKIEHELNNLNKK